MSASGGRDSRMPVRLDSHSKRDFIKAGGALLDHAIVALLVLLMDLERARGQHAHLLHQLLAVVALRLHNLLEQSSWAASAACR